MVTVFVNILTDIYTVYSKWKAAQQYKFIPVAVWTGVWAVITTAFILFNVSQFNVDPSENNWFLILGILGATISGFVTFILAIITIVFLCEDVAKEKKIREETARYSRFIRAHEAREEEEWELHMNRIETTHRKRIPAKR